MVRVVRWFAAIAGAMSLNCESAEENPEPTCLSEQCNGFALEVTMRGARDLAEIAAFIQERVSGLTCHLARARGSISCAPSNDTCGWHSAAETASPEQEILNALGQIAGDAGVDGSALPAVALDDCACRSYVESSCPR